MAGSGIRKVVLAYSGDLAAGASVAWLKETYGADVIAFCADVGQGEELGPLEARAKKSGAFLYIQRDLREELVRDFVFPAIRANAVYEGAYLLGTALARPLVAKHQMAIARELGADAVAHAASDRGDDQVRFELAYHHFDPNVRAIAPWREWGLRSRSDVLGFVEKRKLPVPPAVERPWSVDRSLFHCAYAGGPLDDPWHEPDASLFLLTRDPTAAEAEPAHVEIELEKGNPVAVDGRKLSPAALVAHLNDLGGRHGVGRVDLVEDRAVGMKCRTVYETPGGTLLHAAHRAVESLTLDREVALLRDSLIPRYAHLVYAGLWFSPERELLQRTIDESQNDVTGTARLKLHRGGVQVVGRKSPRTLVPQEDLGRPVDVNGFIGVNARRLRLRTLRDRRR